jgi:hypothetical protein
MLNAAVVCLNFIFGRLVGRMRAVAKAGLQERTWWNAVTRGERYIGLRWLCGLEDATACGALEIQMELLRMP